MNPNSIPDSLFASGDVIERQVELSDGKKHTLYFKELPAVEFRRFTLAERSGDEERQVEAMGRLIARSLVNPDGTAAMTVEKALTLKPDAMNKISEAIMELNGLAAGKSKKA